MAITSGGPWSVKGVDPKAREIAKDLARRSGMTLGEWLNQVIVEGGEPDAPPFQAPYREPYEEAHARRPTASAYAPEGYASEHYAPEPARSYLTASESRADIGRIAEAIQNLSARMEAAEHRSTLAISGVDQSVMGVLSRLEGVERDQNAVAARFENAVDESRSAQLRTTERLRRVEQEDSSRLEALKSLESALTRIAGQTQAAEGRAEAAAAAAQAAQERAQAAEEQALAATAQARAADAHTAKFAEALDARLQQLDDKARGGDEKAQAALAQLREEFEAVGRRMGRVEEAAASAPDTYADASMVEGALTRMAARLEQAETGAREAVRSLTQSLAGLDARLHGTEEKLGELDAGAAERRFAALAADLSQKVEASRAEMADKLRQAADGQFEKMEAALRDVSAHVAQSEQRSAQAIDSMGREVMRVAQTLSQRVAAAEVRSAQAVETAVDHAVRQTGGAVSGMVAAMDERIARADQTQAEALKRLGDEIAGIAEKLAEKIASSDRRSAAAIDDIGEQVTRAADRIDQRHDRASTELTERMRQSEERTARLLEEARDRIDERLAEAQRRAQLEELASRSVEPPPVYEAAPAYEPAPGPLPSIAATPAPPPPEPEPFDPFAPIGFDETPAAEPSHELPSHAVAFEEDAVVDEASPTSHPAPHAAPHTAHMQAPDPVLSDTAHFDSLFDAEDVAPEPAPQPASPPRASTRELLESARAAARAASAGPRDGVTLPPYQPETTSRRFSLSMPKRRKKESGVTLRTAAVASGTAAAITATAIGAFALYGQGGETAAPGGQRPSTEHITASASLTPTAAPAPAPADASDLAGAPADATPAAAPQLAAVALSPVAAPVPLAPAKVAPEKPAPVVPGPATVQPAATASASALYGGAVRRLQAGDRSGLSDLQRAANLGFPAAQFYLAKLYESGDQGMKKDMAEARRWTERAASAGDAKAMHNLGLYYFEGDGGPKNITTAAGWFKRAAELGLQDSQYNLARLYENGYGVSQNPSEAYKWYLAAAAAGDNGARASALSLRKKLSPEEQAMAERAAAALRAPTRTAQAAAPTPSMAAAAQ